MSDRATHFDPPAQRRELVERIARLASGTFAARAERHDREAAFPSRDFDDLFEAGLMAPAVPEDWGGLGLGPCRGDVFTLWMMTKHLAKADLSLARCWEGHVNSLILLDALASQEQKERWFPGVVERGEKWVAWSGEPQTPSPGHKSKVGTTLRRENGDFVVDGTKVFTTSAGFAQWAILLVSASGPGGGRHLRGEATDLLLLGCDLSDPSVSFDSSWWDPMGMRGTVSYLARFEQTRIPAENLIGRPGQYLEEGWQACFAPHYAASFLGAAEGAYEAALEVFKKPSKREDPYIHHHAGKCSLNIETAHLWLRRVARLWESDRREEARQAGVRARYLIEHLAEDTVKRCIQACGARSLIRPSPLERIYRDLSFYVRHDSADHLLATIGKSALGLEHDESFYRS